MEIKYKLYPHPVLWSSNDDYKSTAFDTDIGIRYDFKKINITCNFKTDNSDLMKYINEGRAEYIAHIECPLTSYRKVVSADSAKINIDIPETMLNGKISVCTFIVAKCLIPDYTNSDLNDDYAGNYFEISKGAILAIGKQYAATITKDTDDLASLPSIFLICKKEIYERTETVVELDSDKICIILNGIDFGNYQIISKMPDMQAVIHSSIVFPALIYAFEQIKRGYDEYEEYRWFKAIYAVFKKNGIEFNDEYIQNETSFKMAQLLLDLPINRSMSGIVGIGAGEEDD